MTKTENDEPSMRAGLQKVVELIELASVSVAKLMASVGYHLTIFIERMLMILKDSVPKFLRDPKYQSIIREHQIEISLAQRALSPIPATCLTDAVNPEKSLSRSNTTRK